MNYATVCSGIEAPSRAWDSLGWKPQWFSQFDPDHSYKSGLDFPSRVLFHHYPDVPNLGNMTKIHESDPFKQSTIDLLCGGTPCQSFSVAGLRKGLDDPRGNLMLTFLALADRKRPRWVLWENVPGVLSSNKGRDFGAFLGGLAELGYGWAYRVLDAQYYGVAQRRHRVFVVGCLGDARSAAAVLFERYSLSGYPAPSRKARQEVAGTITAGSSRRRGAGIDPGELVSSIGDLAHCLNADGMGRQDYETETMVISALTTRPYADNESNESKLIPVVFGIDEEQNVMNNAFGTLKARTKGGGFEGSVAFAIQHAQIGRKDEAGPQGKGWQEELAFTQDSRPCADVVAFGAQNSATQSLSYSEHITPTLDKSKVPAVAYSTEPTIMRESGQGYWMEDSIAGTLRAEGENRPSRPSHVINQHMAVRRLTPVECERLQGFPDGYTDIRPNGKATADGPRYKALGNSMAVPVIHWLGKRIQMVHDLIP